MELPAGTLTFLFTDIEGSTRLMRELGPAYDAVQRVHDEALRAAWAAHDGAVVKMIGDAFLVAFVRAEDAVRAAVDAQRRLATAAWPGGHEMKVRAGLHTGFARPADGDYSALVVNQAARVVGAARGGQVLLTDETRDAAGPLDDVTVRVLGRYRVRDFDGPVCLNAATAEDVPFNDAPPRVRPADGHNLVRPATAFVGRDADVTQVRALVAPRRLVTVAGPGGVGKTRLAVEAGLALAPQWADGAWFVDLAPLTDPVLVGEAIGDAVGAPAAAGGERWPQVVAHLQDRRLIVVLDNCEHLGAACATAVAEVFGHCPGVAVLATSREPLGLRGERVHRLAPLPDGPAVELFVERSGTDADRDTIATLCAELDGLPLAIELAAARTSAVPPAEILRSVRRSPALLRSTDPTLPERQRSLTRLLDWSWELLPPAARTVLGRLSVFAGGFDVDAAEVVGAGGAIDVADVPELVWTLIDASLVRPEDTEGATRYRLLATVRAHAASRADAGDLAAATRRLGAVLVDRVGPARATSRAWAAQMALELDNARAAAAGVDDPAVAQTLAWSIGRLHDFVDGYRDGIAEVRRFLAARPAPSPARTALLTLLADLHLRLGEFDRAEEVLAEAALLAASVGCPEWDDVGIARARGELALRRDDPAAAAIEARRGLSRDHSLRGRARLYDLLGLAAAAQGDPRSAAAAFEEELRAATAAGLDAFVATTHTNLAEAYLTCGEDVAAAHHQRVSLGLAREQRQPVLIAFGLMIAARLAAARGGAHDAVALQTRADELLAAAGYALYEEDRRVRAALLEAAEGRLDAAEFEDAVAAGRALTADEAADLAERVLAAVGSAPDLEPRA